MTGSRTPPWTAVAIGLALTGAGCAGDGADASQMVAPVVAGVNAVKNAPVGSPAIADAISRLLPSIDPESADALRGPLTAINTQIAKGSVTALASTIAAAREALEDAFAIAADGPDLDAISLAIDSVDPASR